MKKHASLFIVLILKIIIIQNAFSQTEISQVVNPKKIYVGDTVELRYNFNSPIDFFKERENEIFISLSDLPFNIDNNDFSIAKATLQQNANSNTLILILTPWKPGLIKIPEFDLIPVIFNKQNISLKINPLPIEVSSLLPNGIDTTLRPANPPLLLPGTIYVIYILIFLILAIIICICILISKQNEIIKLYKQRKILKLYSKNAKKTCYALKKLLKKSQKYNDIQYCQNFQSIMRKYLSIRFGKNFSSSVTSSIYELINQSTGGFLNDQKVDALETLIGFFTRCDYIRFARDSIDSQRLPQEKYECKLQENERADFSKNTISIISILENKCDSNNDANNKNTEEKNA